MDMFIKKIEVSAAQRFVDDQKSFLFSQEVEFEFWKIETTDRTQKIAEIEAEYGGGRKFAFGAYKNEKLVGIHIARQKEKGMLHMSLSAVLPEYRRQGIYSLFLGHVIQFAKEYGFYGISSRHNASNNAVIIPKLKAGFLIASMEICDVQGVLVHLIYHLDEARRSMHLFRTGYGSIPAAAQPVIRNLFESKKE